MRTGNQTPTFAVVGDYAYSLGDEVADMFEEDGGATFYPSQRDELRIMLARNADGSPAAMTIGISIPRQNGKSYGARFYAIYMGDFEHRNVLYSAHHSTTTNKMFKAMCDILENPERYPEFAGDVKSVSHVRGYEGIYFKDGGCIEFATRTNSGARGGTYSVIVIDEAQELTADQQEAMLPVISAASNVNDRTKMPQQIFVGTPPSPSCRGTVFKKMHDAAHSEEPGAVWWLEWSVEARDITATIKDEDHAVELAYMTNPAMGYRIAEKTVRNEFENMSVDGYARERLGWWSQTVTTEKQYAIPAEVWDACRSEDLKPEGKTAYAVKFSADGSAVCLCGAVLPKDGAARVSLIKTEATGRGIGWLADWLNERYGKASCVVIDGRNGVDVLVERIAETWRAKGAVIRPSARDVIAAAGTLTDALAEKSVTWYFGQEELRDSAITSVKRPIGGGWGFGGENSLPIEACALALWGAKTTKRDPTKKMLIG